MHTRAFLYSVESSLLRDYLLCTIRDGRATKVLEKSSKARDSLLYNQIDFPARQQHVYKKLAPGDAAHRFVDRRSLGRRGPGDKRAIEIDYHFSCDCSLANVDVLSRVQMAPACCCCCCTWPRFFSAPRPWRARAPFYIPSVLETPLCSECA